MTRVVRLAAATVLVAVAGLTGSAPAYAGACSTATGVTVVVDFHELGGGVQETCDSGGGGQRASTLFPDNGYPLTYVQRQPGFVCRVSGAPADDPCVQTPPADAYWGLWWSDGESGTWTYSSAGVGSLTVPEGGSVALSWNGSASKAAPGTTPPAHEPPEEPSEEPEPSREPTTRPSRPPTSTPSATPSASPSASVATRRSRTDEDDRAERAERTERPERDRDGRGEQPRHEDDAEPPVDPTAGLTADPTGATVADDALPVWVGPSAVGALLGVAGVATYLRRRAR